MSPTCHRSSRRGALGAARAVLPFLIAACGSETAGRSIQFDVAVEPVAQSTELSSFESRSGWAVEFDRADVVFGPVYFHAGGERAGLGPSLWEWLGPSKAYAHPADSTFEGGAPLGDVLEQFVVDMLQTAPSSLGRVAGLEGRAESFEVQLHPPGYARAGSQASRMADMDGHSFIFEGVARRDGEERPFVAEGFLGDLDPERAITSIDADVALVDVSERPGPLLLRVQFQDWFRFVDFGALTEQDAEGRFTLPAGTVEGDALRRGIRSRSTFGLEWSHSDAE